MQENGSPGASPERTPDYLNFRAVLQARAAAQHHGLHHSLRYLLEVVAGFTNGAPAWPSYDALAGITGLSPSRVRQYSYKLVEQGYLTLTRRKNPKGGWGQPEWGLGQVVTGGHSPQVEVSTGAHSTPRQVSTDGRSSVHPRTLASVHPRTQKRVRSGPTTASGGTGKDGGEPRPAVKKLTEEKGAPHPTQVRVGSMIDALKAVDLPSKLTAQERSALLASDIPAPEIAACMRAVADHRLGDQWDRDHLTVNQGIKLHRGWKTRQDSPRPMNGTTGAFARWLSKSAQEEPARADDQAPVRRALPPPGSGL